jgi:O-acetyl-ADP-ribose deacetylase (regulator of RNase III)
MIRYIDGDLLKMSKDFDVIAHCCNCFCTMGAGIAPQIKSKFPDAYIVDCQTIRGDINKLGTISYTLNTSPIIVNLYGQFDYSGRTRGEIDLNYVALRESLKKMKQRFSGKTFGMPKIGAGLAGGDWELIESIIDEELSGESVTIVNYVI